MVKLSELVPDARNLLRKCGVGGNKLVILTQSEIEKLLRGIDTKSTRIHNEIAKNNGWKSCPSLASIFYKKPEADEFYGFSNYGEDNKESPLHYESDGVHYYVAVLFKKGQRIKNEKLKKPNQERFIPEKYFVVNSKGRYFYSVRPITSNVELGDFLNRKKIVKN